MSTISNVFCHDVTIFNYLKIYCQKDFAGHVEYKYITSPRDIKRLLLKKRPNVAGNIAITMHNEQMIIFG